MFLWAAALPIAASGCGPREELGRVTGHVSFEGQPVTTGTISFDDRSRGLGVVASIGPDGSYEMRTYRRDGLLPGSYRVCFSPLPISRGDELLTGPAPADAATSTEKFPPLPAKFFNVATSGLQVEVVAGDNQIDFKLP